LRRWGAAAAGPCFWPTINLPLFSGSALLRASGGARAAPGGGFFGVVFLSIFWDAVLRPGGHFSIDFDLLFGARRGTLDPSKVCNCRRFHGLGPQRPASVFGTPPGGGPRSVFLDFGSATGAHFGAQEARGTPFFERFSGTRSEAVFNRF
jgi:hypothetical protein